MHRPTDRITHTTAFVTPVVEHWLEREIAQWVHPMKDRSDDPSHHERTLRKNERKKERQKERKRNKTQVAVPERKLIYNKIISANKKNVSGSLVEIDLSAFTGQWYKRPNDPWSVLYRLSSVNYCLIFVLFCFGGISWVFY